MCEQRTLKAKWVRTSFPWSSALQTQPGSYGMCEGLYLFKIYKKLFGGFFFLPGTQWKQHIHESVVMERFDSISVTNQVGDLSKSLSSVLNSSISFTFNQRISFSQNKNFIKDEIFKNALLISLYH